MIRDNEFSSFNIADFFLTNSESTPKKIQKLVYYAYSWFIAINNQSADQIENILINGYGISKKKVDEFERLYFEFSFSNGKRAIGTKIYDNIFVYRLQSHGMFRIL